MNNQNQETNKLSLTNWGAIKIGVLIGVIPLGFIFVGGSLLTSSPSIGIYIAVLLGTLLGVPGGIIGALIGRRWKNTRRTAIFGGVVGTILGIGLWNLLFIMSGGGYGIY